MTDEEFNEALLDIECRAADLQAYLEAKIADLRARHEANGAKLRAIRIEYTQRRFYLVTQTFSVN